MKRCASCGREISDSATVCDLCEQWAADQVHSVPAASSPQTPSPLDELISESSLSLPAPSSSSDLSSPLDDWISESPLPAGSSSHTSQSLDDLIGNPAPATAVDPTPAIASVAQPPSSPQTVAKDTQPPPAKSGLGRRELMIVMAALVIASAITFAVSGSRGGALTTPAGTSTRSAVKSAPTAAPAPTPTQTWSTARRGYWTANQHHSAAFELPAENTVPIWMNYVRPLLVVRCMGKRTEAFVYTGSALKIEPNTEDHTVNFHFDNEPTQTAHWPDSAEHDALFAPDGAAFANRIAGAKTLRFGYTPHNAEPAEAQFHVDGLADLMTPAAKDCGIPNHSSLIVNH